MFKKATDATLPEKKLTSHKEKKKKYPHSPPYPCIFVTTVSSKKDK